MLKVTPTLAIPLRDIEIAAIRSGGPGGQNVNKVASAVHLRFDARAATLPEAVKARLLALPDRRIGADGVIVIKAQQYRSREQNRAAALARLAELVRRAAVSPRKRVPTRPGAAAKRRRVEQKKRHGRIKRLRVRKPDVDTD